MRDPIVFARQNKPVQRAAHRKLLPILLCAAIFAAVAVIASAPRVMRLQASEEETGRERGGLSDRVSILVTPSTNRRLRLRDGRDLLSAGTAAQQVEAQLRGRQAEPLAMAADDFDRDGSPELVTAYGFSQGGALTLRAGNPDPVYPHSPAAQGRRARGEFTEAPFLAAARLIELSEWPDFVCAGDFDADGNRDLVTAARGDAAFSFLRGDGRGNFDAAVRVPLPGAVTAFESGDLGSSGGHEALVVGLLEAGVPRALVYRSAQGALRARAQAVPLPARAKAIAVGERGDDGQADIAIAAGRELILVRGSGQQGRVVMSRRLYEARIEALAAGDFAARQGGELAVLTADGAVHLAWREGSTGADAASGRAATIAGSRLSAAAGGRSLARAHSSGSRYDNLVLLGGEQQGVRVLETASPRPGARGDAESAALATESAPVAVLALRLNPDSLSDLVVLRKGDLAPAVVPSAPAAVYEVNSTDDNPDNTIGDGLCADTLGNCTLRAAIEESNADPGADMITFNIGGGGVRTISPMFALPDIIELVTIDGTTQPGVAGTPRIILEGSQLPTDLFAMMDIPGQGIVIRGLVINNITSIPGNGIAIAEVGSCIVEGNFIGTNAAGTVAVPNNGSGIAVGQGGNNNTIGSLAVGGRNLISGNMGNGISIFRGSNNDIVNNIIGRDINGGPLGNGGNGILITDTPTVNNTIRDFNAIAYNGLAGVAIESETGNEVRRSTFFQNGGLAIDLGNDGVTANDAMDPDTGANDLQNFPLVTSAVSNGVSTAIQGTLNSTPNTTFIIELFTDAGCDPSGNGEGEFSLGTLTVMTNAAGDVAFNFNTTPLSGVVTATATDPSGNTSEFSPCAMVTATNADVAVTIMDSPDPVSAGGQITYSIMVSNNGPDAAAGVTFSDTLPAGTTFASVSGASCSMPPVGGTGTVTCNLGTINPGGSVSITLVVNVTAGPGNTITNTASATSPTSDPTPGNNSATAMTLVTPGACSITCPGDLTRSASANQCGASVAYPPPIIVGVGACTSTCTPPPGAFFPVGTTQVTCVLSTGPTCSFQVTVVDNVPPILACPPTQTVTLPAGQTSATVNYAAPEASDNCQVQSVTCLPPSGSVFPRGTTTINCSATDAAGNSVLCSFTVAVTDTQAPVITCPANVTVQAATGQASAPVSYPPPVATDNLPGVTVSCSPASGSTFALGPTTVNCTARDVEGNQSSCGFTVLVQGGPPTAVLTVGDGRSAITYGEAAPVPARRKPKKNRNIPCGKFSIENRGLIPLNIIYQEVVRTGPDVASGRIINPNEGGLYSLSRVFPDGTETDIPLGSTVRIAIGELANFCLRFNPIIPTVAQTATGLPATATLPDVISSRVTFNIGGGVLLTANVIANIGTDLALIDPNNPRGAPVVSFTRSGNEFVLTYSVFDANLDVRRARYELLTGDGLTAGQALEVDLEAALRARNLVRGQSFTVVQRFTGAATNPEISGVRLTVSDGETSVTATASLSQSASVAAFEQSFTRAGGAILSLPAVPLRGREGDGKRKERQ